MTPAQRALLTAVQMISRGEAPSLGSVRTDTLLGATYVDLANHLQRAADVVIPGWWALNDDEEWHYVPDWVRNHG